MECEMCGAQGSLVNARIEGSELRVCNTCAKYGKVIESARPKFKSTPKREEELDQVISPDFAKKIKSVRESLGLNQEDFSRKLQEKTSVMSHIESGKNEPSIALAKKLEKMFGIKLIEFEKKIEVPKTESGAGLTIGDFIKVRKANK